MNYSFVRFNLPRRSTSITAGRAAGVSTSETHSAQRQDVQVHDIAYNPPPDWSTDRCMEYFNWTERVVGNLRGIHAELEAAFDAAVAEARSVTAGR